MLTTLSNDWLRTHNCGELSKQHDGQEVTLMGWIAKRRDLGQLIFIDLRDQQGLTQMVIDPADTPDVHKQANSLRQEYVIAIKGKVRKRPENMVNTKMKTGAVEVIVETLQILNKSEVLPFSVTGEQEASETLRLKHRYIDLRRQSMKEKILARSHITSLVRQELEKLSFCDLETPYLYKSTPEGAREFLVPSRINPKEFYALPQSPQLFKQLFMISGFDRYYQIVKCFRDEDLRADRQPEFTQIDCEMAFVNQELILNTFEKFIINVVNRFFDKEILTNFPRITYHESMERYGCDKPDTRFGLELKDISSLVQDTNFRVFQDTLAAKGLINVIVVKDVAKDFSRKKIDELTEFVKPHGLKGLAWAKVQEEGKWQSPIAKFFSPEQTKEISEHIEATENDLILFGAGSYSDTKSGLSALRNHLGKELKLYNSEQLNFL